MKTANLGGTGKTVIDKHVPVSVSLHPAQLVHLQAAAREAGCSVSSVVQAALDSYLLPARFDLVVLDGEQA